MSETPRCDDCGATTGLIGNTTMGTDGAFRDGYLCEKCTGRADLNPAVKVVRPPIRMCVHCNDTTDQPIFVRWVDSGSGPGWNLYACPPCAGLILSEEDAWGLLVGHGSACPVCTGDGACAIVDVFVEVHRAARERARSKP
jgi:hypothetical protein